MNLTNEDLKGLRDEQVRKMQECKDADCVVIYDAIINFLSKYIEE
jgi:hypothetical protein